MITPEQRTKNTAYAREWRHKNPDKVKAAKKREYQKHKVELIAKALAWKKANPEKARAAAKRRYDKYKDSENARARAWRLEHLEHARRSERGWRLRGAYGISLDDYDRMVAAQGNKCAICGLGGEHCTHGKLFVDHDHRTHMVRGLLCHNCNRMLGMAADDPSRLEAGAMYLRRRALAIA